MKRGEKAVLMLIGIVLLASVVWTSTRVVEKHDRDIPFYSEATADVARRAMDVYRENGCKSCHSLWTLQDMSQSVPAPMLDGIGSLRSEQWLRDYLSSPNPQAILPSRLKKQYQMPSYARMSDADRAVLVQYMAGLKVKDWYLADTKKAEYEKLTGMEYKK
ncbi:MAG: cytochrome c [Gallionella sp.]|nr:cytochrome c [Gallionella sp.]